MRVLLIVVLLHLMPSLLVADWRTVKEETSGGIVRIHVVHENPNWLKPYRRGEFQHRRGTGFFISNNHIVTNQHIVEGAHEIKIEGVNTKEKFSVRLAAEPSLKFDLAILEFSSLEEKARFERINGDIKALKWAEWEAAQPGSPITVLGYGNSEQMVTTRGIISAWEPRFDRYQRRLNHVTLIRTDAAVVPGNSGGPAVSPEGKVIGVSARYENSGNIGLLIPFDSAKKVVDSLLEKGKFTSSAAGFVWYSINPVLRRTLNLSDAQTGVVISHVYSNSAAEQAGLRQWDVVTAINGNSIQHGEIKHAQAGKLPFWFSFNTASPGTKVNFEVLRDNKLSQIEVTLGPSVQYRHWFPTEGADYAPEWGYLGGMLIVEVTRGLLNQLEDANSWRWDLVNDSHNAEKLYIVADIEPATQAMSYEDYDLDLYHSQIVSINGEPIRGSLQKQLNKLYQQIETGAAPAAVTVEFEQFRSIQLEAKHLLKERNTFYSRVVRNEQPQNMMAFSDR